MLAPGSQASLRESNSKRIVEAVKTYGGLTQVELASTTGLSAATVSNIVKQLEREGVVETRATTRSGRRAQQVTLARSSALAFGVHLTRRGLQVHLSDFSQGVRHSHHLPLPADHRHDTTLDRVALLVGEVADEAGATIDDVVAVGVAVPASITVRVSGRALSGWEDVDIADTLSKRLGRPVVMHRQADAAAVAEYRFGALRGVSSALYVRVGDTTEASLLFDGVARSGASSPAGAIGHVQVDSGGPICRCGARGCLDTRVSAEALADLLRVSHGPLSLRQIVASANRGDPGCRNVIADTGSLIGPVVANAATLLGVDRIVIGGELAASGDVLLSPIRDALRARPLLGNVDDLLVESELGQDAEAMGAAALAHDTVAHPYSVEDTSEGSL